jgi:hypothetical protein
MKCESGAFVDAVYACSMCMRSAENRILKLEIDLVTERARWVLLRNNLVRRMSRYLEGTAEADQLDRVLSEMNRLENIPPVKKTDTFTYVCTCSVMERVACGDDLTKPCPVCATIGASRKSHV